MMQDCLGACPPMMLNIGQPPDHSFDQPLGLLSDCHRRIEYFLDVLVKLERLASSQSLTVEQQLQVEGALRYFNSAAPRHTADEEESLFPRLRASNAAAAARALHVLSALERDHELADAHYRTVERLWRRRMTLGGLPESETRELRDHLGILQAIYRDHIAVEDRELFPLAAKLLSPVELRDVGREMAARRR